MCKRDGNYVNGVLGEKVQCLFDLSENTYELRAMRGQLTAISLQLPANTHHPLLITHSSSLIAHHSQLNHS